jgi:hypothetical protein
MVAVAHDQPVTVLVHLVDQRVDVGVELAHVHALAGPTPRAPSPPDSDCPNTTGRVVGPDRAVTSGVSACDERPVLSQAAGASRRGDEAHSRTARMRRR